MNPTFPAPPLPWSLKLLAWAGLVLFLWLCRRAGFRALASAD